MSDRTNFEKVIDFHHKYGVEIGRPGEMISPERRLLRIRLMISELSELVEAMYLEDYEQIADGIGDLLYTVYGTGVEYGIPVDLVFDEINRSNMTKEKPTGKDGKIKKGANYRPPNYEEILP